jgi:hypothetical protein
LVLLEKKAKVEPVADGGGCPARCGVQCQGRQALRKAGGAARLQSAGIDPWLLIVPFVSVEKAATQ